MQTEELLTGVYGELHELLGDHREFKRVMLSRLSILERDVKEAPGLRVSKLCALVSALSGLVSLLGGLGIRLAAAAGAMGELAGAVGGMAAAVSGVPV